MMGLTRFAIKIIIRDRNPCRLEFTPMDVYEAIISSDASTHSRPKAVKQ